MITFEVKDMTCGHCVSAITKALKDADEQAKFTVDRATSLVTIESTDADPKELQMPSQMRAIHLCELLQMRPLLRFRRRHAADTANDALVHRPVAHPTTATSPELDIVQT